MLWVLRKSALCLTCQVFYFSITVYVQYYSYKFQMYSKVGGKSCTSQSGLPVASSTHLAPRLSVRYYWQYSLCCNLHLCGYLHKCILRITSLWKEFLKWKQKTWKEKQLLRRWAIRCFWKVFNTIFNFLCGRKFYWTAAHVSKLWNATAKNVCCNKSLNRLLVI